MLARTCGWVCTCSVVNVFSSERFTFGDFTLIFLLKWKKYQILGLRQQATEKQANTWGKKKVNRATEWLLKSSRSGL